jgi:hypothetical protein
VLSGPGTHDSGKDEERRAPRKAAAPAGS